MKTESKDDIGKGHGWLVSLFLVGLVLMALPHIDIIFDQESFGEGLISYLADVGGSLLVGVVLVYTLEQFTRKRQQRENQKFIDDVNKNVLASVYKRKIC